MANAKQQIQKMDSRQVVDLTLAKIDDFQRKGELSLPSDYNAGNALNAAYLKLQETKDKSGKPATAVCTPASVAMALLDMVVQGLDPAKNQCYFVVYGDQLTLMRSYQGTMMAAKRFGGVKNVFAQVVYADDVFEYEINPATGVKEIKKHQQTLANVSNDKIIAAYASVVLEDGTIYQEIMTMDEIQKAWQQGATNGKSPAHTKFAQEMAKKTVINRACKNFVNTSTDSTVLADSFNRTTANEYQPDESKIVEIPDSYVEEKEAPAEPKTVNLEDLAAEPETSAPAPAEAEAQGDGFEWTE